MNRDLAIKEALRYMLLPVPPDKEQACIEIINDVLTRAWISEDDFSTYLRFLYDEWRFERKIDRSLAEIVEKTLLLSNESYGKIYADKYFELHEILTKVSELSFSSAVLTLSHLQLLVPLALQSRMSSSKITKILQAADERLEALTWKDVQAILRKLKIEPVLDLEVVEIVYEEDEKMEVELFADADIKDAILHVGRVAEKFHFDGDMAVLLNKLASEAHRPYLQMLHYQCLIVEFYDHLSSYSYEFNPRGIIANRLFEKWEDLLHTSNPFLNNAKAVDVLDENWARAKRASEQRQAFALVTLLKGLERLGYAAAKELAAWIRRFLVRYIRIERVPVNPISLELSKEQIGNILKSVISTPTRSYGILEQRLVDVISFVIHSKALGWRARGISDSVNANNISKRKLGDCDFQQSVIKEIVAYEVHGGHINQYYLEGHLRTLRRSFDARVPELNAIADLHEWKMTVVFVAYGFDNFMPQRCVIDGTPIKLEYVTFSGLLDKVEIDEQIFLSCFKGLFIEVINNKRTPSSVRDKIREMNL